MCILAMPDVGPCEARYSIHIDIGIDIDKSACGASEGTISEPSSLLVQFVQKFTVDIPY